MPAIIITPVREADRYCNVVRYGELRFQALTELDIIGLVFLKPVQESNLLPDYLCADYTTRPVI